MQREAFIHWAASPRRRRAALADQRGGRHLPTCHAVNRVVHEEDADLLAAVCGMNDLGGADRSQVAIALISNHDLVRAGALQCSSGSGSAPVRDLYVSHVEVIVRKDRTADGADENGLILQFELL